MPHLLSCILAHSPRPCKALCPGKERFVPFGIRNSEFGITQPFRHPSLFPLPISLFTVHCSLFTFHVSAPATTSCVPSGRHLPGAARPEKSRKNCKKTVDPGRGLCYTLFYLSDERFLFARFFLRAQGFLLRPHREAMPAHRG